MGILDGLLGNATEVNVAELAGEFDRLLADGERLERAYQLIRDMFLFTDKRLILLDRQGLSGKKVEYRSIPYRNIRQFSVETAGTFDLEAELKIWVAGSAAPISKTFNKKLDIYEVQQVLASYVL